MSEFIFGSLSTLEKRVAYVQASRRGVQHGSRLRPHTPRPGQSPTIFVTTELDQALERVVCTIIQPEKVTIELQPADITWDLLNWTYMQTWQAVLPAFPAGTLVRYLVHAHPADGSAPIPADDGGQFSYLVAVPQLPDWAREAIVYQIFPDRFHPGPGRDWQPAKSLNDIHGGTLDGITAHLDYVADLGFNCLWLNPFFPDDTHHGYHAHDYFQVNPRLGTLDDMRRLVDEAHRRGLRLILDFVANHWGSKHATFQAALADRHSEYHDWYNWIAWPHEYESFFGVQDLPQVNVNHPAARQYLLKAADFWLREMGFDGYRLDYALGPSLDFWTEFRAVCKAARPDAWLFGEVVETPYIQRRYSGRLDGCLDFGLTQAIRNTFAFGTMRLSALDALLNLHETFFPDHFSRPSFLDNHDMNRFLWLVGGDQRKLKLATLLQFTLAGPPVVYYGSEVGLSQVRDIAHPDGRHLMEESRLPMRWGAAQDKELHHYYRQLIHFRRQHPVLARGRRQTVHLDDPAGTYAYIRQDDQETVLVALNLSEQRREINAAGQLLTLEPWRGDLRLLPAAGVSQTERLNS